MKALYFLALSAVLGCGSDAPPFTNGTPFDSQILDTFTACGGDPKGPWQAVASLSEQGPPLDTVLCAEGPIGLKVGVAGSANFDKNNVEFDFSFRIRYLGFVSESCIEKNFPEQTCNTLPFDEEGVGRCAVLPEGCQCVITFFTEVIESGSYDTDGRGETDRPFEFCVTKDEMITRWSETRFDGKKIRVLTRWVR